MLEQRLPIEISHCSMIKTFRSPSMVMANSLESHCQRSSVRAAVVRVAAVRVAAVRVAAVRDTVRLVGSQSRRLNYSIC